MAGVAATAIVLAVWKPVVFLALLAVFSFYSAFHGYRALSRKRPLDTEGARPLDWAAAGGVFGAGTAVGVLRPPRPSPQHPRSGEHTSELHSPAYLVCPLLLLKKKKKQST